MGWVRRSNCRSDTKVQGSLFTLLVRQSCIINICDVREDPLEKRKGAGERAVKRTPIFAEVHNIRNKLTCLRAFVQAIERPDRWKALIPKYRKECENAIEDIDASALRIGSVERRRTRAKKNTHSRR
jgi:hypothetical protein